MDSFKRLVNITGWGVFAIALIVYFLSAERTGSLWDCGEFVAGAYKLQVVHPPGAALFLLVGRMFTIVADIFSDDPANIAFSVNILSGICSAFAAAMVCWVTIMLSKLAFVSRTEEIEDSSTRIAVLASGAVAGLATAFATSVWFSAVEGEVYAMSTFFTTLVLWAMVKWYTLPDTPDADRWIVFAVFAASLSTGVHLLSLLTFPALALFYYFKKYKEHNLLGMAAAAGIGIGFIVFIQSFVIVGIPKLWSWMELLMVNTFGLGFHTGLIPTVLIVGGLLFLGFKFAHDRRNALAQKLVVMASMAVIAFSVTGVVVIRANADTPINMNSPSDAMRLLPYLNREQYGERPLLYGPHYMTRITGTDLEDRYGRVGDEYKIVDQKAEYKFDPNDQMLFPRLGHLDEARRPLYEMWLDKKTRPTLIDNFKFFFTYQINWMYWRYFMWNFAGRQNGEQGFYPWDKSAGNWLSGIGPLDSARLGTQANIPDSLKANEARNKYYLLPIIFGIIGLFFQFFHRREDFLVLLVLFIITGIGIIVYSNQPPNEPRERDYVLVGSFFTFCIWIGMAVPGLYVYLKDKISPKLSAIGAAAVVLIAPLLMGFQNFDDNSRRHHTAARDYASNFLHSVDSNAIIFTYGDNDTYPLWYAQEVEEIRTDVRVVNLSLIAVDWYIDQLRRKVNNSPAIKMTMPSDSLRGSKRLQIPVDPYQKAGNRPMNVEDALKFLSNYNPIPTQSGKNLESYFPTKNLFIPVDRQKAIQMGMVNSNDTLVPARMNFTLNKGSYMLKGDAAVLDIITSNMWERPVYFAVTCRQESLLGLQDYTQLEGLALRVVPKKGSPERIYGMIGNGTVNTEKFYDNFMNRFKWGNFDKYKLFVDRSYSPTIQTTRFGVLRTARTLLQEGQKDKAVAMLDQYFKAFPDMNFPYDANTILFVDIYIQAGEMEKAKTHLRILAEETAQRLLYYETLGEDVLNGYQNDMQSFGRASQDILRLSRDVIKDPAFEEEMKGLLGSFNFNNLEGRD